MLPAGLPRIAIPLSSLEELRRNYADLFDTLGCPGTFYVIDGDYVCTDTLDLRARFIWNRSNAESEVIGRDDAAVARLKELVGLDTALADPYMHEFEMQLINVLG